MLDIRGGTQLRSVGGTKTLFSKMKGGRGLPLFKETLSRGQTQYYSTCIVDEDNSFFYIPSKSFGVHVYSNNQRPIY